MGRGSEVGRMRMFLWNSGLGLGVRRGRRMRPRRHWLTPHPHLHLHPHLCLQVRRMMRVRVRVLAQPAGVHPRGGRVRLRVRLRRRKRMRVRRRTMPYMRIARVALVCPFAFGGREAVTRHHHPHPHPIPFTALVRIRIRIGIRMETTLARRRIRRRGKPLPHRNPTTPNPRRPTGRAGGEVRRGDEQRRARVEGEEVALVVIISHGLDFSFSFIRDRGGARGVGGFGSSSSSSRERGRHIRFLPIDRSSINGCGCRGGNGGLRLRIRREDIRERRRRVHKVAQRHRTARAEDALGGLQR
ncbi:hypothetical protein C8R43DRAFT_1018302 [Mycena crocata]|nr:hypothetical protein C8R43DRAFT_1018302 [Mycena crocata]